jgi:ATP-binding protein involved in chromosome partitioning
MTTMRDDFSLKADVIDALERLKDPQAGPDAKDLVTAGVVQKVEVAQGAVKVTLLFDDDRPQPERHALEDLVCDTLEAIDGVADVSVLPTTRSGPKVKPEGPPPPKKGMRLHGGPSPSGGGGGGHDHGGHDQGGHSHGAPTQQAGAAGGIPKQRALEGVGQVIAVASGKGGVGKSTVAVNLALALSKLGYKVGLLDIDIYGPSLPTLLGVQERPAVKERRIIPLEKAGLRLMSLGFLMEEDTPVIWRGPIVTGIIRQFLQDVDWRGLDYLIVDLPPGTGDAQLSLAQTVPVDGAVVVTTPSDLALIDAARGLQMFKTLNVEVLGIVENMSHYTWPAQAQAQALLTTLRGQVEGNPEATATVAQLEALVEQNSRFYIFGEGGGAREAARLETALLGEIPLDGQVRKDGDAGSPIVLSNPDGAVTQAFLNLAHRVAGLKPVDSDAQQGNKKGVFSFMKS